MATAPDITEEQRANLTKLAAYLRSLPAGYRDFDMGSFSSGEGDAPYVLGCGTAGCAVGHGPSAGVEPQSDEDWFDYAWRAFGAYEEAPPWGWCFDSTWILADNTPHGAAARIEMMLADGVPDDWREQMLGSAPLSYTAEAA